MNALTTLLNNAQLVLTKSKEARIACERVTNSREVVFREVGKLASRMYNALKSSGANPLTIEDARFSVRKLRGTHARKPEPLAEQTAGEEKPSGSKARGLDYASMTAHFAKLVETISAEALYNANEPELALEWLKQKLSELQRLNTAIIEAVVQLDLVRTKVRGVLYTGDDYLVNTAMATKFYLRSLFGYRSEQFVSVSKLHFTRPHM